MDLVLTALSLLDNGLLLPFLVVVALAILIWFLSWLLFPGEEYSGRVGGSLSGLEGLDAGLAAKLRTFGIHSDRDLIRLPPRGQQELESQLDLHQGQYAAWRRQILERWRTAYLPLALRDKTSIFPDPELGGLYTKKPERCDDLTQLAGVDALTANRLQAAGIYTFEQIRHLTPEQRASFRNRFKLTSFNFDAVPIHVAAASLAARATAPSRNTSNDNANQRPDLPNAAPIVAKSTSSTQAFDSVAHTRLTSTSTDAQIPKSKIDAELGRVYTTQPPHRDDLTKLDGIASETASRLNAAGIYTIDQLLSLSPVQQGQLKRRFDLPHADFENWRRSRIRSTVDAHQAVVQPVVLDTADNRKLDVGVVPVTSKDASDGTHEPEGQKQAESEANTSDHPTRGQLYSSPPQEADDLTRLLGVDVTAQQSMNELGIYRFDQIQALNNRQLFEFQRSCNLGSVEFADWQRCIYAWMRGVDTIAEVKRNHKTGWLHGVRLPEIAARVFAGTQLVAYPEQVIFRGTDPKYWGTDVGTPSDGVDLALPASSIRSDINYVRIRRVDTRESVVTPITKGHLFAPGPNDANGWNGLCESFFGGLHLGVFANDIPNEVETKFGFGGWGFGHRRDHDDQQEWTWAGRMIPPTKFEISVGHVGALRGTVIFRSSDPTIWNQRARKGAYRMAIPLDAVTHPICYVRLQRVDTGEAIIVRIDRASLLRHSENPRLGWNGLNEHFSGGHHLGIFHRDALQDVEVCFGQGGWGFGHPYGENDRQAYGWAGHSIGETVFEISVLEQLPDYLRHELLE